MMEIILQIFETSCDNYNIVCTYNKCKNYNIIHLINIIQLSKSLFLLINTFWDLPLCKKYIIFIFFHTITPYYAFAWVINISIKLRYFINMNIIYFLQGCKSEKNISRISKKKACDVAVAQPLDRSETEDDISALFYYYPTKRTRTRDVTAFPLALRLYTIYCATTGRLSCGSST